MTVHPVGLAGLRDEAQDEVPPYRVGDRSVENARRRHRDAECRFVDRPARGALRDLEELLAHELVDEVVGVGEVVVEGAGRHHRLVGHLACGEAAAVGGEEPGGRRRVVARACAPSWRAPGRRSLGVDGHARQGRPVLNIVNIENSSFSRHSSPHRFVGASSPTLRGMADELTADDVMGRTAVPILEYGRGWMLHADTIARSAELGLDGPFGFWVNGRAGVLGDADADVAAAAIGFMAPAMVRHHWETPTDLTRRGLSAEYAASAAAWGRNVLADVPDADLDRVTELCDRIADAALPSTGALFAGWRSVERPDDAAGRVTVALNVVRELRGGAHLSAVHAVGLGPHGAIMSTDDPVRGGAPGAERFGWSDPHPTPDPAARAEAERLTSAACRSAFETLTQDERADFVRLVTAVRSAMD